MEVWFSVSSFKEKGEPMECGTYSAVKLLEHAVKVIEHVFQRTVREKVNIDGMQFGFWPGKGTTDAVFTVRHHRLYLVVLRDDRMCFS